MLKQKPTKKTLSCAVLAVLCAPDNDGERARPGAAKPAAAGRARADVSGTYKCQPNPNPCRWSGPSPSISQSGNKLQIKGDNGATCRRHRDQRHHHQRRRHFQFARHRSPGQIDRLVRRHEVEQVIANPAPALLRAPAGLLYIRRRAALGGGAREEALKFNHRARPQRRADGFLDSANESLEPYRSYPDHLAPRARRQAALSDPLGGTDRARTRPDHRHRFAPGRSQRHRQPWRLLRALSRARGFRRARSIRSAGRTSPTPIPP